MSTEIERELERTTQLRGFRYGLHDFLAQVSGVEALKKLNDAVEHDYLKYQESLIDRKTKELAIIVACVAQKDTVPHLQVHMHAAHKAGATAEEILALLNLVGGWIGEVAKLTGLEAWRATFRSDLPTIDRVVELR
jgi:alkylhydroperoxidase/carboxymuconolactone decarboxylase family protein YurZ